MKITVLGGTGAWPVAGGACSGYLIESAGFRLLIDPGYAVLPKLLELMSADTVDAVLVSHGHPDHCADLNPLLRARALQDEPPSPLPVHALRSSLDAVLALDRPGMLDGSLVLHEIEPGKSFTVGPFDVQSCLLPHFVPNVGVRVAADGFALAYTGDCGPTPAGVDLARGADLFLAEATYVDAVPAESAPYLTSARQAGRQAANADVRRLLLTHLWPGTSARASLAAAASSFDGWLAVARGGLVVDLGDAAGHSQDH